MTTYYYSQGSDNWSTLANWDTNAGGGGSDPASVAAMDDCTFIIQAGHTITYDIDASGWANGIAGLTITSHATTPGMLRAKYDADNTYYLKLKTGTTLAGTNAAAKGRLLANSDGVWGNTGALAFGRKFIIELGATGKIDALYLDIALYCYQPAVLSATVYGTIQTVSSINTSTNVITLGAAHGWTAGTAVMVTSDGTYPGGLAANTVYYVRSPSGADLKLALQNSDATLVDITSAGTGTIRIFNGHTNTSTATVNVLEDLRAVTGWTTTDGHDAVVLADAAAPADYDQQRLQLTTINAGSLVLSANVDSAQYPGARVWLISRNVAIRSACTTGVNIIDYGAGTHSGVFQCEIRSTAGTGTTFYGSGINAGTGHTVSGAISGCGNGVNAGTGHTISGVAGGCSTGVYSGTGHTISGVVSGCYFGVSGGIGHTISGAVSGCSFGIYGNTGYTVSGTISGCSYGSYSGVGYTVSGAISGCSYGFYNATGYTISGAVSGCSYGIYAGSGYLHGATFSGNTQDVYPNGSYWQGWGVTLGSATQVALYKHSQVASVEERNAAVAILDLGGVSEAVGFWTLGGYTKSATYAAGTHGTPPTPLTLVHESTFEDNDRLNWAEYALWALAGQAVTVTFYGKLTGTSAWTTRPSIGIYDPTKNWQAIGEALNVSAAMASNTDWQTLTATYTPTHDRELRVRMQGCGGNAGGTGTEQLYWFAKIDLGGSGGGAVGIFPLRGALGL